MILDDIASSVRRRLFERKQYTPLVELERRVDECPPCRDFKQAVSGDGIKMIAEIKRASPSKRWSRFNLNPAELARCYTLGGAAAISVLTEEDWFKGSLADLAAARQATDLPLLCKDFILDPYQIYEARIHGADAILLITALLAQSELARLIGTARALHMTPLVEVHTESELEKSIEAKADVIGINNRNLVDFSVDTATTMRLRPLIPPGITVISESGVKSRADVLALQLAGVNAVLVGESLVLNNDSRAKLRELIGS